MFYTHADHGDLWQCALAACLLFGKGAPGLETLYLVEPRSCGLLEVTENTSNIIFTTYA